MIHIALTALSLVALSPIPAPTPVIAPASPVQVAPERSATTRYCIVETFTGSRIPTRICHTRAEWLDRGTDPLTRN